jgi:hypothetical protein
MVAILAAILDTFLHSGGQLLPASALCLAEPFLGCPEFPWMLDLFPGRECEQRVEARIDSDSAIRYGRNRLRLCVDK